MTHDEKCKAIQEFCQNRNDGGHSCYGCPLDTICTENLGMFRDKPDKANEAYAIITWHTEHDGCEKCIHQPKEHYQAPCNICKGTVAFGSDEWCNRPDMWTSDLEPNVDRYEIHKKLCIGLNDLYVRKNHDYGNTFGDGFKEYGLIMPAIRLEDKFNRFKQLALHPEKQQVKDESIVDTLRDLANYALMTITEMEINNHENKD